MNEPFGSFFIHSAGGGHKNIVRVRESSRGRALGSKCSWEIAKKET